MLEIRNLTKVYDDGTQALKDVSFSVKPREFLVVIGLSGSGKSTLLRCINRLVDPTEGDIILDGESTTNADQKELSEACARSNTIPRRSISAKTSTPNLVSPPPVCSSPDPSATRLRKCQVRPTIRRPNR